MLRAMPPAQIFTILNHYTRRQDLDPDFGVLDNSANERPDWYEYWPIRNFLRSSPLDEGTFYGFLSPRFAQKTNLGAAAARAFVDASADADVVLFSPSIHNSAYFLTSSSTASRSTRASSTPPVVSSSASGAPPISRRS